GLANSIVGPQAVHAGIAAYLYFSSRTRKPSSNARLTTTLRETRVKPCATASSVMRGTRASARLMTSAGNRMLTGCRSGELLALDWEHVDLDAAKLTLSAPLSWLPGKGYGKSTAHYGPPKTDSSRRTLDLAPELVKASWATRTRPLRSRSTRTGILNCPPLRQWPTLRAPSWLVVAKW